MSSASPTDHDSPSQLLFFAEFRDAEGAIELIGDHRNADDVIVVFFQYRLNWTVRVFIVNVDLMFWRS